MAIHIPMHKVTEDETAVVYDFGTYQEIIGQVMLDKASGKVDLLQTTEEPRARFYLPRVTRVLKLHFEAGEYPDETCYTA